MSKRTFQEIEQDLVQERIKKRRVDASVALLENELNEAFKRERLARAISVPWSVFSDVTTRGDGWIEMEINDIYDDYKKCEYGDCWYSNNMDRLGGLTLYKLSTADDEHECIICDICMANNRCSSVLEDYENYHFKGNTRKLHVLVDPEQFKPKNKAILVKASTDPPERDSDSE
jgi:hypothetical protein